MDECIHLMERSECVLCNGYEARKTAEREAKIASRRHKTRGQHLDSLIGTYIYEVPLDMVKL